MHQVHTGDPIATASPRPAGATAAADNVRIRPFTPAHTAEWDAYVHAHPHGSPFHLTAWKGSITDTFGYEPLYLAAERNGALAGVLPLFAVRNPLMGKALLSSPFAVYGGPLADDDSVKAAFAHHLHQLGHSLGVQYVELRNAFPGQSLGFSPISRYVTFTQDLGATPEAILESIPRKTRRMVRKSLAEGFTVHTGTETPSPFEDLFSRNLRRLGTPAFPANHYRNLLKYFAGSAEIREIRLHGRLAAAVFTFYFNHQVLPYYGASDPAFNPQAPNNFMYYGLMCAAAARGCTLFDFGRSKRSGSGSYDFKAHWGMVERELPYEMLLVRRKQLPDFSPANPVFQWPIRIWQRLPLPVTRAIGPWLIRMVP
jgi:FemAB-related protein (PEP-CTERM system-associated)